MGILVNAISTSTRDIYTNINSDLLCSSDLILTDEQLSLLSGEKKEYITFDTIDGVTTARPMTNEEKMAYDLANVPQQEPIDPLDWIRERVVILDKIHKSFTSYEQAERIILALHNHNELILFLDGGDYQTVIGIIRTMKELGEITEDDMNMLISSMPS